MVPVQLLQVFAVSCFMPALMAEFVPVTVYWTTVEDFKSKSLTAFTDVIKMEAMKLCGKEMEEGGCKTELINVSLSVHVVNITQSRSDIDMAVAISSESDKQQMLPAETTSVVLNSSRATIETDTGHQVVKIGDKRFGVKPDDPNNWIISGVFIGLTLILLAVTIYLVRFKVNPAEEHFEEQKGLNGASEIEA